MAPPSPRRPIPPLLIPMLLFPLLFTARSATAQSSNNSRSSNNNDNYNGLTPSFNPSMAIVIVVLVSAFFFLGFFSIYLRQCGGAARNTSPAPRTSDALSRRGLDQDVLETFPTFVYSEVKGHKIGKGSLECAVCLSQFEDDETLRLLPKCSHVFHSDCIDAWLAAHVTCPVCRSNLVLDPAGEAAEPPPDLAAPPAAGEDQVAIEVDEALEHGDRGSELADLARIGSQRRAAAMRTKSIARPMRFPRSYSTGHSILSQHGENLDRFTLRLPDHVKKEILVAAASRLQRTKSCVAFPAAGESSFRRGYRTYGEGSSRGGRSIRLGRSDRWPSFLVRTLSARFHSRGNGKRGDGEGSTKKADGDGSFKGRLPSVRVPFECLGGGVRADGNNDPGESQTVALNRV